MPTARELLEQADALMRRNRKRGKGRLGDVPTLTDALGVERDGTLAPTVILPETPAATPISLGAPVAAEQTAVVEPSEAARQAVDESIAASVVDKPAEGEAAAREQPADADPISLDTLGDVPILTDAVVDWPPAAVGATVAEGEPIAGTREAASVLPPGGRAAEPAPAFIIVGEGGDAFPASAEAAEAAAAQVSPPAVLERQEAAEPKASPDIAADAHPAQATPAPLADEFILEIPPAPEVAPTTAEEPSPIPSMPAPPMLPANRREWDALAEEIRMQVLQRLDLFTDTGLRDQLGARLQPIVDRASAQLIETINHELGELVRGYVADAIEREIESWRKRE